MYNMSSGAGVDVYGNTVDPVAGGQWGYGNTAGSKYSGTDGWTNGGVAPSVGDGTGATKWVGTTGLNNTPFGYTGAHMNWGFEITGGAGGNGTISTLDSFARYGMYADIDVAKGAWSANNTGAVFGGWRHDLDVGLFKSDTTGLVTLSATALGVPSANFGFTVFQGMDTVTDYNHHGQWNNSNNWYPGAPLLASNSSPYAAGGATAGTALPTSAIVAYSIGDNPTTTAVNEAANLNTIQFNAVAGQYYTIFIGGYRNGDWGTTNAGYSLQISQVPVPAAVWLLGSALAGMGIIGRRRDKVTG
ncbi:MAG: VPLPA-CTERM sorting domain-containing protein [Methylococcaceae bacterium]|nr:VPLPA-CTERM sorting domain-containing protein [Methylococcaceae bacterium]